MSLPRCKGSGPLPWPHAPPSHSVPALESTAANFAGSGSGLLFRSRLHWGALARFQSAVGVVAAIALGTEWATAPAVVA